MVIQLFLPRLSSPLASFSRMHIWLGHRFLLLEVYIRRCPLSSQLFRNLGRNRVGALNIRSFGLLGNHTHPSDGMSYAFISHRHMQGWVFIDFLYGSRGVVLVLALTGD